MEPERKFLGVWIPREIWLDNDLSLAEKCLLIEICSLHENDSCWATNQWFANFFNLSKRTISRMISSLQEKNYIDVILIYEDGTKQIKKRILRPYLKVTTKKDERVDKMTYPHDKTVVTPHDKSGVDNNIYINNINNNIDNSTSIHEDNHTTQKEKTYSTHSKDVSDTFSLKILKTQIRNCYQKLDTEIYFSLEEIYAIVDCFMGKHQANMDIQHPKLSNGTIIDILENISTCWHSDGRRFDIGIENYPDMIDFYFTQDFAGNQYGKCDYSIAHFMLGADIRANCFYKTSY